MTTEWRVPFTYHVYWTSQHQNSSTLSTVVQRYGLDAGLSHKWLLVRERDGNSCGLGDGGHLVVTIQAAYVANFIECACKCNEKPFAQAWLKVLLDPAKAYDARFQIPELPPQGISTQKQFEEWWKSQDDGSSKLVVLP